MVANTDNSDDDDFGLFRSEMHDADRLHHDSVLHVKPKPQAKKIQQPVQNNSALLGQFSDMFEPDNVGNEEYLEYRGPGIQHRTFSKLRNGKMHIEAALDLHGMTLMVAESELDKFLEQCRLQQLRCVRIIHGKGWSSKENKPILKSKMNYWLKQNQHVLAFCSATIADGGTGAVYVLLKRQFQQSDLA